MTGSIEDVVKLKLTNANRDNSAATCTECVDVIWKRDQLMGAGRQRHSLKNASLRQTVRNIKLRTPSVIRKHKED